MMTPEPEAVGVTDVPKNPDWGRMWLTTVTTAGPTVIDRLGDGGLDLDVRGDRRRGHRREWSGRQGGCRGCGLGPQDDVGRPGPHDSASKAEDDGGG